ncbi:MAG: leucine dehydrogenase [Cyclobacteriaceae bacterium]|nr:leucine dehydrogenase [Cyclobacteriaceae bacterium]
MGHEQVMTCYDESTGLKAIIAVHNTVLGPSMGGTRMWNYTTDELAWTDALRLSRGMTLKNSIAGLNLGGGKAVIIGDVAKLKNKALMRKFGEFVNSLGGKYWTAEDVNMTTQDMEYIKMETPYVTGMPESKGGGGDPSPITAFGVYMGMKAALKRAVGSDSLEGRSVLVQGVGHVGSYLIDYLRKENANVLVSDIFESKLKTISEKHNVTIVSELDVYHTACDVYSPCALGATLDDQTIKSLNCSVVAGGANNQLLDEKRHGKMLVERGIIYAPDFLINGGGITNCYFEYTGNYNRANVMAQTEKIYETTLKVLDHAEKNNSTPQQSAIEIALDRIKKQVSFNKQLI